jgi:hypothetical protein
MRGREPDGYARPWRTGDKHLVVPDTHVRILLVEFAACQPPAKQQRLNRQTYISENGRLVPQQWETTIHDMLTASFRCRENARRSKRPAVSRTKDTPWSTCSESDRSHWRRPRPPVSSAAGTNGQRAPLRPSAGEGAPTVSATQLAVSYAHSGKFPGAARTSWTRTTCAARRDPLICPSANSKLSMRAQKIFTARLCQTGETVNHGNS